MMIIDAIETAQTEHVIYFLLTAYVETLGFYDPPRSFLPPDVSRLPILGNSDVTKRLRVLRETLDSDVRDRRDVQVLFQEAVDLFDTALQRLRILEDASQTVKSWSVMERRRNAHDRRRGPGRPMTGRRAAEWGAAQGPRL
jgi:hypothetical protein